MIWPTTRGQETVRASRVFGAPRAAHTHGGIDLGQAGDWALAAAGGRVLDVRYDLPGPGSLVALPGVELPPPGEIATLGLFVRIRHADGYETRYGHLGAAGVMPGQAVQEGHAIGTVGRTGFRKDSTTSAHLHFEVWRNGSKIDPLPLLDGAGQRKVPTSKDLLIALGVVGAVGLLAVIL